MKLAETSTDKRDLINKRISHFIQSIRLKMNLSQYELSQQTGRHLSEIKRLENTTFISTATNAYCSLNELATIGEMSLQEFVQYIANVAPSKKIRRSLFPWEEAVLKKLHKMKASFRRKLVYDFIDKIENIDQLEDMLQCAIAINSLNKREQELVKNVIAHFRKD